MQTVWVGCRPVQLGHFQLLLSKRYLPAPNRAVPAALARDWRSQEMAEALQELEAIFSWFVPLQKLGLPVCTLCPLPAISAATRHRSCDPVSILPDTSGSTRDRFSKASAQPPGARLRTFRSKLHIEIAKVSMNIPQLWMIV